MGRTSIEYETAVEYLKDGQWHDREKTMRRIMDAVPPGRAAQMAERLRIAQLKKASPDPSPRPRRLETSMEDKIRVGARVIARQTLNNKVRFETSEDRTMVRLVPEPIRQQRAAKAYRDRGNKSHETRLRKAGIDPATHVTLAQLKAARRAEMQAWTPEQWEQYRKENSRKSWESRNRRKKEADALQDLHRRSGPEQETDGGATQ